MWPCRAACGILVPRPRIEPLPPVMEAKSLNNWTAREVPGFCFNYYTDRQEAVCYMDSQLFPNINSYTTVHVGREVTQSGKVANQFHSSSSSVLLLGLRIMY